jgi:hypothetical protein
MIARTPMGKSASPTKKPVDKAKQQREAKKAALLSTITAQEKIIDRYQQQQDSDKKPDPKQLISEEEYEAAKTKRDVAQAELNELNR